MRTIASFLLGLILTLVSAGGYADAMRCGSSLVSDGDTKYEVLSKCGEPQFVEVTVGFYARPLEVWTYQRGPNQFVRLLTFRGTRLTMIETAGYR